MAVAVNVAPVCPALTVMLGGTVRFGLLLERATESPPVGAAKFSETVHSVLPGVLTVLGVHATEATWGSEMVPELPVAAMVFPVAVEATTLVI